MGLGSFGTVAMCVFGVCVPVCFLCGEVTADFEVRIGKQYCEVTADFKVRIGKQ